MDLANYLSWKVGLLSKEQFDAMHAQLSINFPDHDLSSCSMDEYFGALSKDKKNIGNNLGCILSEGPGRLVRQQIPFDDKLKDVIVSYFDKKLFVPHHS
jgi:3-dehydroquinate synthase